jgi:hypothetical protein
MWLLFIAGEVIFVRAAACSVGFSVTQGAPADFLTPSRKVVLVRSSFVLLIAVTALLCAASASDGSGNSDAKWGLHFAGIHDAQANNCSFRLTDCSDASLVTESPGQPGHYDVYVIALDVSAVAGTRYGICCEGSFFFYGWTSCSDFEIPTTGWPASGEGNAQVWNYERSGPHVTIGILDIYAYTTSTLLSACVDPRTGMGQWCDGASPSPVCDEMTDSQYFGSVGFGTQGYNPCGYGGSGEETSWGRLKTIYRK